MRFIATAEHTSGQSVGHSCHNGIYSDPTDDFQVEVEAESTAAAHVAAENQLAETAARYQPCQCDRQLEPGGPKWWNSVSISLWPQEQTAWDALAADGLDLSHDPYQLIPSALKEANHDPLQ